eukprot:CAMPEP_0202864598 /NCGR_PEP_ID=MMETSP1391-20130828/4774_1 /ASSEMBLY_ACC=CAM_ASM_000867 /TAXON_ID=1034604 /ORGANISM="Chlamydomonas leiostraca, Strain SAG 11-49" /LENGTH=73 /DNA_ID=CAMNT_0049544355 /DNA_START=2173 /DNA_END=2394 /DNA_ORIENTATION=-
MAWKILALSTGGGGMRAEWHRAEAGGQRPTRAGPLEGPKHYHTITSAESSWLRSLVEQMPCMAAGMGRMECLS